MPSSPRASMMVIPWSPTGPETITASPGCAVETDRCTGRSSTPIPAVFTKQASALPRCTTLVSPVTICTPARSAAAAIAATMRRRSETGKPSSSTNPAER